MQQELKSIFSEEVKTIEGTRGPAAAGK